MEDKKKYEHPKCFFCRKKEIRILYDLSIDEVKRAMDGEEYWCI